eukprot:TRINITY_DN937_c0_g1_i2.p1 TRINITY_DN937_c0_g1~~TRINITY_DN937_c0_g1_i2.p1  ORF type:complete len:309 (-),score=84.76 TRINITY_DN937_c0_g1_i2:71-997(-)
MEATASMLGRLNEVIVLFQSLTEDFGKRIESIEEREQHLEEVQKKVEDSVAKAESQIDLNIGGSRISTSKSTLLSIEGTYFYAMLSSDYWKPNSKGEYFVDRSPIHFHRILSYLRTGVLSLDGMSGHEVHELSAELDYYQIPSELTFSAFNQWQWDTKKKGDRIVLSNNNRMAQKTGDIAWDATVIGNKPVDTFQLKLTKRGLNGSVMVGMAPQTVNLNAINHNNCGWYMWLHDGTLYARKKSNGKKYTLPVEEGSVIQVTRDKSLGTISFNINGQDKGVAFYGVPADLVLYPAIEFSDPRPVIEIIS